MSFLQKLEIKDIWTIAIAAYGAALSTFNFGWPRLQEWRAHRVAIFKALQGEKEAIAEIAYKIKQGKLRQQLKNEVFRKKLITALSMAFTLEGADRAKAYVVAAMECLKEGFPQDEITGELETIQAIYCKYYSITQDDDFKRKRLEPLNNLIRALDPTSKSLTELIHDCQAIRQW